MLGFAPAALAALEAYPWPGNVRELLHAVERAVILTRGETVELADLPEPIEKAAPEPAAEPPAAGGGPLVPPGTPLDEVERMVIRETLRQTKVDKDLAAQILGIAPRTIYRKLDRDESGRLLSGREEE